MTTRTKARTFNPDTIPVRNSRNPYIGEMRWIAACYLANLAKLSAVNIDEDRRSHSLALLRNAEEQLAHNCELPLDVAQLVLLQAVPKARMESKSLIAKHGDLLQHPEPFANVYADNVVELVGYMQKATVAAGLAPFRLS